MWKVFLLTVLLFCFSFSQIVIKSNYPLRKNNFLRVIKSEDIDLLLWTLQRLKDVKDINIEGDGKTIIVYIERYPIVKRIKIKGNVFASDRQIKGILLINENEPLTYSDINALKENLVTFYKKRGFLDVKVKISIKVDKRGFADIRVNIEEGNIYFLRDVIFKGAKAFNKEKLLTISGLVPGDIFNYELANDTVEKLSEFYRKHGFWDSLITLNKVKKERLRKPFFSILTPGLFAKEAGLKQRFISLFRGASNFLSYPRGFLKALIGRGSVAVVEYKIEEGQRYVIEFKGNKSIPEKALRELIDTNTAGLDLFFLEGLRSAIEEFYKRKGFFDIEVTYSYSRNKVTFHINEGKRYKLRVLGIRLRDPPEFYDEAKLGKALKKLEESFRKKGYLSAKVETIKDIDRRSKVVFLVVKLRLGTKIILKDVKFIGKDNKLKDIFRKYKVLLPKAFDEKLIEDLNKDIVRYLRDKGYLEGDFWVDIRVEEKGNTLFLTYVYKVVKGPRYSYGKLLIYGNEKTHWREIYYTMVKEKFFSQSAEEESLWNLMKSEIFTGVKIDYYVDTKEKKVHRLVEVREDKRGLLELFIGYDTLEKFKFGGGIKLKNLFGVGIILSMKASKSQLYETYEMSLLDKFLFSRKYSTENTLFRRLEFHRSFDLESQGFSSSWGYAPKRYLKIGPFFSLVENTVEGVDKGRYSLKRLGLIATYDRKDNPLNPKNATFLSLRLSQVEGDKNYPKYEFRSFLLRELAKGLSIDMKLSAGSVGKEAPVFDRFFLGGLRDMKGYSFESIGSPLGGRTFVFGQVELLFAVRDPLWVGVYTGAGNVAERFSENFKNMKQDIGFALGLNTPAGFFRVDAAKPVDEMDKVFKNFRIYLAVGFVY